MSKDEIARLLRPSLDLDDPLGVDESELSQLVDQLSKLPSELWDIKGIEWTATKLYLFSAALRPHLMERSPSDKQKARRRIHKSLEAASAALAANPDQNCTVWKLLQLARGTRRPGCESIDLSKVPLDAMEAPTLSVFLSAVAAIVEDNVVRAERLLEVDPIKLRKKSDARARVALHELTKFFRDFSGGPQERLVEKLIDAAYPNHTISSFHDARTTGQKREAAEKRRPKMKRTRR